MAVDGTHGAIECLGDGLDLQVGDPDDLAGILFQQVQRFVVHPADSGIELSDGLIHFFDAVEVLVVGEADDFVLSGHSIHILSFQKRKRV